MIGDICGSYQAGLYGFASQLSNAVNLISTALDQAFSPMIYMSIKNHDRKVKKKINGILEMYGTCLFLVLLIVPELIIAFGSNKYYEAKWLMPPIILASFFLFLAGLFMKVEFYYENNTAIVMASTGVAILNIILNYKFINLFGYVAAAYTTLFSYGMFSLAHFFFMQRTLQKQIEDTLTGNEIFDYKTIVILSVIVILILPLMLWMYTLPFWFRYILLVLIMVTSLTLKDKIKAIMKKQR